VIDRRRFLHALGGAAAGVLAGGAGAGPLLHAIERVAGRSAAPGSTLASSGPSLASPCAGAPPPRPNVLYIRADDLGYADLSVYGRPDYATPVLDRLAAEGVRLTQAYSIAPVCTPTRVGFMTGRYPARHPVGVLEPLTVSGAHRSLGLSPAQPTISSRLRAAGYHTGHFGKWHLGRRPEFGPERHGFDESFGPLDGAVDYLDHHNAAGEHGLYRNGREVRELGYLTDLITERAAAFVGSSPSPFFACVQYTAPHWPWQRRSDAPYPPDRELWDEGSPGVFPEMVRAMDDGVGRILAALSAAGLAERTLVVFTSDNGGERYSNMGGLRGRKFDLWEGGIRVPAIVRWPGVTPSGTVSRQVVTTLDWHATILAVAAVTVRDGYPLDGEDVLPILAGTQPERERTVFWRTLQRTRHRAVRSGRWKYLATEDGEFLFDLENDPGEAEDLRDSEPDRFEALKSGYAAWEREMLPPVPR
jgi:arylsulfatase A-like enzyme